MEDRWAYLERYRDRPFTRPPKVQLFQDYLDQLTHTYWFSDTLIEPPHRDAFDQLIDVWKTEDS